ncbi:hypothetical protein ABZ319_19190 [Nocardia sp. NPDC005978]|uniref:hypothetical protein n=1 Tax=Nocardia sp. NPDC005978 TaxID=3156725 RepID=UPI0033A51270
MSQTNPLSQPKLRRREVVNTGPFVLNGQQVDLPPGIQPVYVVGVPTEQIASAVMRGVIYANLLMLAIALPLGILIGVLSSA